jgi:hypothetical protein
VVAAFATSRREFERSLGDRELDSALVRRLVEIAGKRFPAVRYDCVTVHADGGGPDGRDVPRWAFGGNEVYFGFEQFDDESFWTALARLIEVRRRPRNGSTTSWVKVVAFAPTGAAGGPPPPVLGDDLPFDLVRLDRSAVASLYAADALVKRAQSAEIDAEPGRVLGILADQLDFFWKRLTRPAGARAAGRVP